MKKAILVGMLALAACGSEDDGGGEPLASETEQRLAELKTSMAKYREPAAAEAAGFVAMGECVESPEGGMGVHYVHPEKSMAAPRWDDPSMLLYVLQDGELVLGGVEYFQPVIVDGQPYTGPETEPPPAEVAAQAPELFEGKPFDGPMPGHEPGMPWHFDQHVWLFVENPAGLFAPWNPAVGCE